MRRAAGWARSHTRVMTPSVPSRADEQLVEVGAGAPAAGRRRCGRPCRRRARPRGRRPCPRSCRSACEYWPAPRHATQPPTVAMSKLCGKWPTVSPCAAPSSASRSGPNVPASTSTMPRGVVDATTPGSPVRSSTTPPNTGTDAPHTPLRPPAAVTGTPRVVGDGAAPRRPASVDAGRHDRRRRAAAPRRRAPSAWPAATSRGWPRRRRRRRWWSGRPRRSAASDAVGQRRPRAGRRWSPCPSARSVRVGCVMAVASAARRGVSVPARRASRRRSSAQRAREVGHLAVGLGGVPAELGGEQRGDRRRRPRRRRRGRTGGRGCAG